MAGAGCLPTGFALYWQLFKIRCFIRNWGVFMQSNLFVLAFATISFSISPSGIAQSLPDAPVPVLETQFVAEQIDTAAKTPQMLLIEMERQELALYELFNGLTGSDEFDIACRSEPAPMSDITLQFCEPAFLKKIRQQVWVEQAQDSGAATGLFSRIRNAFVSKDARTEELVRERAAASIKMMQQEMQALAMADPQLAEQIQTVGQLQLAYLDSVQTDKSASVYLMRQNDPGFDRSSANSMRSSSRQPWLGAPAPGHTQPTIHYPADVSPRYRR